MKKKIIIAAVVIVLLAGLTALLFLLPEKEETPDVSASPDVSLEPTKTVYLINEQFSSFEYLRVYNEEGKLVNAIFADADSSGETSYRVDPAREGWDYSVDYMRSSVINASTLSSLSTVAENPSDLSQYGLDAPKWKLEVGFGGRVYKIEVGDPTALANSYYCSNGDGNVYAVGAYSVSQLTRSEMDYRVYDFFPSYFDTNELTVVTDGVITYVRVYDPSTGFDMIVRRIEDGEFENNPTSLYMESPYEGFVVDEATEQNLINPAVYITVDGVYMDDPTEEDLAEYGFDTPRHVWIENEDGDSVHYIIGRSVGTNAYVMVEGLDTILTATNFYDGLFSTNYVDILFKMLLNDSVREIASVDFVVPGETHQMKIVYEASTEDNPGGTVHGWLDGEAISTTNATRLYARVLGMQVYEAYDKDEVTVTGAPQYRFTVTRNDGGVNTLELYELNSRRFAAFLNGEETGFAVHRDTIRLVTEAFGIIARGDELERVN